MNLERHFVNRIRQQAKTRQNATALRHKINGLWKLFGMRSIDTLMKKTAPEWWYNKKKLKVTEYANREITSASKQ